MSFKTYAKAVAPLQYTPDIPRVKKPFNILTDLKPGMRVKCLASGYTGEFVRYAGLAYRNDTQVIYGVWDQHPGEELSTSRYILEGSDVL